MGRFIKKMTHRYRIGPKKAQLNYFNKIIPNPASG